MEAKELLSRAEELGEWMTGLRRELHARAEVGFELPRTLEYVREKLGEIGLECRDCGRAGLVAELGKGKPCFLLRADMDGLPIPEETGLSFAAVGGASHACGHDMHTAMLLAAARLLKEREGEIKGTVRLMFQPAEEIFEGARDMLESGLLDEPGPGGAMMIHVMAAMPRPSGTVMVSMPGVSAPAADYFEICVKGRGCHGSMPNTGVDPLSAAAHIIIALQEISARELPAGERAVLTIGSVGGCTVPNVIPDSVSLGGTLRAFDEDVRAFLKERICSISAGVAAAFRAEAEVSFSRGCPSLFNDGAMVDSIGGYARELLGDRVVPAGGAGSSGSEDFAYVSREVPSVMLALCAGSPEEGYVHPQHHPQVRFDEGVLPAGSALMAWCALRWLEENG